MDAYDLEKELEFAERKREAGVEYDALIYSMLRTLLRHEADKAAEAALAVHHAKQQ